MLTSTKFAQRYIQFLQEKTSHLAVKVEDEHSLKIELKDRELSIFLNNAYDEYLNNPDDIDRIIERYCSTVLETAVHEKNNINVASIVPVIRHADYLQGILELMDSSNSDLSKSRLYFERLNTELVVLYVEAMDGKLRFLSEQDIDGLTLERKSLREKSIENLKTILPQIGLVKIRRHVYSFRGRILRIQSDSSGFVLGQWQS